MRRAAMQILANAPGGDLADLMTEAGLETEAQSLRGPETGLVTVRGRIGGGGAPFNVGEATVTRASVRLGTGEVGHAYSLGRDARKVRLAAIVDALLQRPGHADFIQIKILAPLKAKQEAEAARSRAETAATKVDFFTMVRGED